MNEEASILSRLSAVIEDRKVRRPANSYTTRLFDGGVDAIGRKVHEEAAELIEAAELNADAVIHEAADLVYHLLVMLAYCDVGLSDVEKELQRRFGTSGLDEKASRTQ